MNKNDLTRVITEISSKAPEELSAPLAEMKEA
jgi:hypothetical protein